MFRAILLAILLLPFTALAENDAPFPEPTQNPEATFRIFRTQNIFTMLELDTRTGLIWQVQWGFDDKTRFLCAAQL